MDMAVLLDRIIYEFHGIFGSQNFRHFVTYIWGLLLCEGRATVSNIYLFGRSESSYWALLKFLSRSRFPEKKLAKKLLALLLVYVPDRIYVYDHTHAIKTGKKQWGLHFFRNHRYRKRNTNQSKFHWGHEFAAIGLLSVSAGVGYLFPIFVTMILPGAQSALSAFHQILSILPPGLIIFDRGFNNRKYFIKLLKKRHHLLCRARSNMVFYYLPKACAQPKRGRKRIYGKRADIRHWTYSAYPIDGFNEKVEIASCIVRTKSCPVPVRLVVRRVKPKRSKPYRYFMVYTTDLSLSITYIMTLYKRRWTFETAMRDGKENLGLDHYQVKGKTAILRHVQLSFTAGSLLRLFDLPAFVEKHGNTLPDIKNALQQMNIQWYHPQRWTLGLMARYLKWMGRQRLFLSSYEQNNTCVKCAEHLYTKDAA